MKELNVASIKLEFTVHAPLVTTWRCLTEQINAWWSKDFYTSPKTKEFILELRPGGRMYEDYGNDEGLLWADVLTLDGPHLLELRGHLSPKYGGPKFSFLTFRLSEENVSTHVIFTDVGITNHTSDKSVEIKEGWRMLLEDGFKVYVEKK